MNCVVLLTMFLFAVSAGEHKDKCKNIFHPDNRNCCSMKSIRYLDIDDTETPEDLKECRALGSKSPSCAREECVGKKLGYYKDGVINMEAITKIVEGITEKDPELQALIKEKCLNSDINLSKYGMPDMCDLATIKMCFLVQMLKQCPEWSDRNNCQDVKQLVAECATSM